MNIISVKGTIILFSFMSSAPNWPAVAGTGSHGEGGEGERRLRVIGGGGQKTVTPDVVRDRFSDITDLAELSGKITTTAQLVDKVLSLHDLDCGGRKGVVIGTVSDRVLLCDPGDFDAGTQKIQQGRRPSQIYVCNGITREIARRLGQGVPEMTMTSFQVGDAVWYAPGMSGYTFLCFPR